VVKEIVKEISYWYEITSSSAVEEEEKKREKLRGKK
jgi:hypothetical protein